MKKILLICVTYHSDKELSKFLESVHHAAERGKDTMRVDVAVIDNGQNNRGYFGGALPIYNERAKEYDFVSISNVDLQLSPDFFERLLELNPTGIGWIVPDIYTAKINRHENPYMITRPTKRNFVIWDIIYSSTLIYRLYHKLYVIKSKRTKTYPMCDVYAGHGSFMLFTAAFVQKWPELHFPGFMYGEEIFMAELVHQAQLIVRYVPNLRIDNTGNVSTGLINQDRKSRWSKESLQLIRKRFFT